MSKQPKGNPTDGFDLTGADHELDDGIRRRLSPDRALLWQKAVSDRRHRGVSAAISYLRALVEDKCDRAKSELDAVAKNIFG